MQPYPIGFFYGQYLLAEVRNRVAYAKKNPLTPACSRWVVVMFFAAAPLEIAEPCRLTIPFRFEHERHDNEARKHYRELREQEYGGAG